jgi:hypothetical protein
MCLFGSTGSGGFRDIVLAIGSLTLTAATASCRVSEHLLARLEGVEPPARGFEGRCSIQLSYRRVEALYRARTSPQALVEPGGLP